MYVVQFRKTSAALLATALLSTAVSPAFAAGQNIHVEYNGQAIAFPDQKPLLKDSRTLVPIRPIAESLGFDVEWNGETRTVVIRKGHDQVRLVVSQKIARKNAEMISLDVPTQIVNGRTMVPVRFIAEALQYEVNWDQSSQTVSITDPALPGQAVRPAEQLPAAPQAQPQENTGQPAQQVELVDTGSITANSFNLMGLGIYAIKGKIDPDAELTVKLDDRTYEVEVNGDGTFLFELMDKIYVSQYELTAVKDGAEQVVTGEFAEKKR